MKKLPLYFFLFIYSTVMWKPVLPYCKDAIAHILFYQDHMQTVHAHHGKFHVHTELANAAKKEQDSKNTNNIKRDNFDTEYLAATMFSLPKVSILPCHTNAFVPPLNHPIVSINLPPPRC